MWYSKSSSSPSRNFGVRDFLLECLKYEKIEDASNYWVPKIGCEIEHSIYKKILDVRSKGILAKFVSNSISTLDLGTYKRIPNKIFYRKTGGLYFKIFLDFLPTFIKNGVNGISSRQVVLSMKRPEYVYSSIAVLNSDLFWWWYTLTSNMRDVNPSDVKGMPVSKNILIDPAVVELGKKINKSLKDNSIFKERRQKANQSVNKTQTFIANLSKDIIEEINATLAPFYSLISEEVFFLNNYDYKFRIRVF